MGNYHMANITVVVDSNGSCQLMLGLLVTSLIIKTAQCQCSLVSSTKQLQDVNSTGENFSGTNMIQMNSTGSGTG